MNDGSKLWVEMGCQPDKLVIGMAFYGRSYILGDVSNTKPGAYIVKYENGGDPGGEFYKALILLRYTIIYCNLFEEYTKARGFMSYYEVGQQIHIYSKYVRCYIKILHYHTRFVYD